MDTVNTKPKPRRSRPLQRDLALPGTRVKSRTGRWAVVAPNVDGKLAVTRLGAVYSAPLGRKLKLVGVRYRDSRTGKWVRTPYQRVSYRNLEGAVRTIEVHRLVAWTFLGPPPAATGGRVWDIHHLNGNPRDNRVSNLEYVEPGEHGRITRNGNRRAGDGVVEPVTGTPEWEELLYG